MRHAATLLLLLVIILCCSERSAGWRWRRRRRRSYRPVNCSVSSWTNSGSCSRSCGPGKQKQTRRVTRAAKYGGTCTKVFTRFISCQLIRCRCKMSSWRPWSKCRCLRNSCRGFMYRTRSILIKGKYGCSTNERKSCKCSRYWG